MRAIEIESIVKRSTTAVSLPGYDTKNQMHSTWSRVFSRAKHQAGRGSHSFNIPTAYAWELIHNQEWKCALSGVPFTIAGAYSPTQASLDRIDSNIGYEIGNVQYVTLRINYAKKAMSNNEFIQMCRQVTRTTR